VTAPTTTLGRRIRADLEHRIRIGTWAPGHKIPTEAELVAAYGCSRMTVSKAITALVQAGLIERNKKAGSFVARPHVQTAVLEIPDLPALMAARGEAYRFQRLSLITRPLDPTDPSEAGLGPPGPVLAVSGLHFSDEEPFAVEHRILNLAAAPDAADQAFEVEPPGSWLLRQVPWTKARHRISAVNPEPVTARLLKVSPSRACLQVDRHTVSLAGWVTVVRLVFPGHRYDLTAAFEPARSND
jgi:GntR family histidine utilization transcriptional repressor